MVIEKTMPTTVMIAAAIVANTARAESALPFSTHDGSRKSPS